MSFPQLVVLLFAFIFMNKISLLLIICFCLPVDHRHWKELMQNTGTVFDMDPDTFTLAKIFSMELHRFQECIQQIVTSASKEMAIEKVSHVIFIKHYSILKIAKSILIEFIIFMSHYQHRSS